MRRRNSGEIDVTEKPRCPFCGGDRSKVSSEPGGKVRYFRVECGTCGALGPPAMSVEGAETLWARRAKAT